MKRSMTCGLLSAALVLMASPALAQDDEAIARTGSRIKTLPKMDVHNPVAEKPVQNADNADLSPELQAILAEAEQAEAAL
ncbi:MAG: hypothetical protein AAFU65_10370 [Pseudomonadota bacterium]